jgi:hypothetical protein
MEHEVSLPCQQWPVTGPYPEPNELTHALQPYLPKIHMNIILPLCLRLSSCLFPSGLPTEFLYTFLISPTRSALQAHFI